MNRTCWQGNLLQICSKRYVLILSNPKWHNSAGDQIWWQAHWDVGKVVRASIQRRALTNCSHWRCELLSGISRPDLFLDLENSSLAKTYEKFWLIAGHFSGKRCTPGCLPRCSFSKQSCPTKQSPPLWLMEVLPARLSSGVPVKASLQLWHQPYRGCAFPCCIYPLRFRVFSLGSPW